MSETKPVVRAGGWVLIVSGPKGESERLSERVGDLAKAWLGMRAARQEATVVDQSLNVNVKRDGTGFTLFGRSELDVAATTKALQELGMVIARVFEPTQLEIYLNGEVLHIARVEVSASNITMH